jgi:hypothetical protein
MVKGEKEMTDPIWRVDQLPDFTVDKVCPNPKCGNHHFFEKVGTKEFSYCPMCGWTAEDLERYLAARDQVETVMEAELEG